MRKKILPIMLAFAFLFSALVIVADGSDADTLSADGIRNRKGE